jgi:hypothetical protein
MAAGATYSPIATTTLGSNTSSVTLSGIPSTYTDLVFVMNGSDTGGVQLGIRFNSDTGNNYSNRGLTGNGSSAYSVTGSNAALIQFGWDAYLETTFSYNAIINIPNYANTNIYKTVLGRANNAVTGVTETVGLWRSTSAITSITLLQSYGTDLFKTGSTFTLYGIEYA